jgi:hypothetical protein
MAEEGNSVSVGGSSKYAKVRSHYPLTVRHSTLIVDLGFHCPTRIPRDIKNFGERDIAKSTSKCDGNL